MKRARVGASSELCLGAASFTDVSYDVDAEAMNAICDNVCADNLRRAGQQVRILLE